MTQTSNETLLRRLEESHPGSKVRIIKSLKRPNGEVVVQYTVDDGEEKRAEF